MRQIKGGVNLANFVAEGASGYSDQKVNAEMNYE